MLRINEHHELAELMEVAIDRIQTARQEIAYIHACLQQAKHQDALLCKGIHDELILIGQSQARILGYISRIALARDKQRSN